MRGGAQLRRWRRRRRSCSVVGTLVRWLIDLPPTSRGESPRRVPLVHGRPRSSDLPKRHRREPTIWLRGLPGRRTGPGTRGVAGSGRPPPASLRRPAPPSGRLSSLSSGPPGGQRFPARARTARLWRRSPPTDLAILSPRASAGNRWSYLRLLYYTPQLPQYREELLLKSPRELGSK
jgi:hypothetical protein